MSINLKILIAGLWILVVSVSSIALFQISFQVEELEKKIKIQDKKIADATIKSETLRAEWAYISRPERVSQLASLLLPQMQAMNKVQYQPVANIQERNNFNKNKPVMVVYKQN